MSQENVEAVRKGVEAWLRGDRAAALSYWDGEIEWVAPPDDPDRVVVVGPEAAAEALASWMSTWEQYRYELIELIDAGDSVVQVGRQVMAARGAEVGSDLFFVWTFRDRRAVRMRMFYDRRQALEAAGLPGVEP
jgi:ketosteroid isomerase-like protein